MKPHYVYEDAQDMPEDTAEGRIVAMVHPASEASVKLIMSQADTGTEGRSPWVWVRLPNGDLILGVYPQGDTYEAVEGDACFPL